MTPVWTIEPLLLHTCLVPGPEVFFHADFDRRIEIAIFAFVLASSDGTRVLVDTGLPADYGALNQAIRKRKGDWSGFRDAGPRLAAHIAQRGLNFDAIILTSFGPYATGGLTEVSAPRLFVSRRGMADIERPEVPVFVHPPSPAVRAALRASTDAVDIKAKPWPGLSIHEVGIHHPASMAVVVETAAGRVAIADPVFHAENLTRGIPLGVAEYAAHWVSAVASLAEHVDAIFPIHDPAAELVPVAALDPRLRAPSSLRQEVVAW
jgi:hypothetical protein